MKKHIIKIFAVVILTGTVITGCSSTQKATNTDSVNKPAATVPDTTRSSATHMDPNKKPPI